MNHVFISYSASDSIYAFRIYYDLCRSGLKVYIFEHNAEHGVDFEKEIRSMIDDSYAVCLIDSPNARKSQWVKRECGYARRSLADGKIIPCIIEKKGEWFFKDLLFPGQTTLRGIDFSDYDYLDYKEKYRQAVSLLCKTLDTEYKSRTDLPQDRDFEKEMALLDLHDDVKSFFINDYKLFYFAVSVGSGTCESRIKNLIKDCERYNVCILSCYLALGAIYADNNEDEKASGVFEKACRDFPEDARSWAALSGAYFYLQRYRESLETIDESLKIIEKYPDNQYLQCHKEEVVYNKIQVLIRLEEFNPAYDCLSKYNLNPLRPEYLCAKIILSVKVGNMYDICDYNTLIKNYYCFNLNSGVLNRVIGDMECCLGRWCYTSSDVERSISHFNMARKAQPSNISYHAEYFLLKKSMGALPFREINRTLEFINPQNDIDYYYCGLIYFLAGRSGESEFYFNKSKVDKDKYPDYSKLIIA